jgi:hypothetical protein
MLGNGLELLNHRTAHSRFLIPSLRVVMQCPSRRFTVEFDRIRSNIFMFSVRYLCTRGGIIGYIIFIRDLYGKSI